MPIIERRVLDKGLIYSDEYTVYDVLGKKGYEHKRVNHSEQVYVVGNVHTNTIEGFWSLLKNGLRGVHHSVSSKHLQGYVDEYAFRYNHRDDAQAMFVTVGNRVREVRAGRYGQYAPLASGVRALSRAVTEILYGLCRCMSTARPKEPSLA